MLSKEEKNTLRNIGLQFFAEDGAGEDPGTGGSGGDPEGGEGGQGEGTGGKSGKTFTQEEVNRLMKAEKESAKKALLKELGVEDAKSAKEGLAKYKEILDKDKTWLLRPRPRPRRRNVLCWLRPRWRSCLLAASLSIWMMSSPWL